MTTNIPNIKPLGSSSRKVDRFDPFKFVEELTKQDIDPSVFEQIDESHIKRAPNFLDFVISPNYLNTKILPRQVEIGIKLFSDYCPRCSKEGYLEKGLLDQTIGEIKDNIVMLEKGKCPKCKTTKYELFKNQELQEYNELVGCMGQRSGKTKLVGLASSYVLHRYLKIPNPLRYFNQPTGELLMGTFSALTAEQARDTLWESFKGFIDASPWFKDYHTFLKDKSKELGIELYHDRKSFVYYHHKRMLWHYTGSEGRKLRGKTRIFGSADELGLMNSDDNKKNQTVMNADAVYTSLTNSLSTMRMKSSKKFNEIEYDIPPVLMCNISSPMAAKDKIMRLLKDAQKNPKILAVHLPTWEANPDYTYESLRSEYAHVDDVEFDRDFGAIPPLSDKQFIETTETIDKIAQGEFLKNLKILPQISKDGLGHSYTSAEATISLAEKNVPRMLTFDLGHTKNGLGMAMFSLDPSSKIRCDMLFNLTPDKRKPINIANFFDNVTIPIIEHFNIRYVFFDRWQSLDQIHRLREMGIEADSYSLTYKDFENVRGMIVSNAVTIPKLGQPMKKIVANWMESEQALEKNYSGILGIQILTVRDLGHRMVKPMQGDDDLFRSFCLGINRLSEPGIRDKFSNAFQQTETRHVTRALGSVRLRSADDFNGSMGTGANSSVSHIGVLRKTGKKY